MITAEDLQSMLDPHAMDFTDVAVPPGWLDLTADCHKQLVRVYPEYKLAQIKEKFGGLRYYVGPIPQVVSARFFGVIRRFEDKSFQTCQSCGAVGTLLAINHWYYTLCPEHAEDTREWAKAR